MNCSTSLQELKFLIIEDEPLLHLAYKLIFEDYSKKHGVVVKAKSINNYLEAKQIIKLNLLNNNCEFHVCLLDIRLDTSRKVSKPLGEDIGILLRKYSPNTKIIVATSINEIFRYYSIHSNFWPEGFLIKAESDNAEFEKAITTILNGGSYFGKTFTNFLNSNQKFINVFDNTDRKMLHLLNSGFRTADLPDKLCLSLSAIEKRKRKIAKYLNLNSCTTSEIIQTASEFKLI